MIAKRGVFFLAIFLILIPFSVWGKFPKPVGYVNDFANILDPEWEGRIDFLNKPAPETSSGQALKRC